MKVTLSQASSCIKAYLKARLVPLLVGSPGCGKSEIVYQIAAEFNLLVIDLRLAQCDPCDLAGFPSIEGGKADYVPMKHFPIVGDPLPAKYDSEGNVIGHYDGWLLFLDEITSASPTIQA